MYVIDYKAHTIREEVAPILGPDKPSSSTTAKTKVETISGLRCNVYPVTLQGKLVGQSWISIDYGIDVKQDLTIPSAGATMIIHTNLKDITPGEPPDSLFVVDPSFKTLTGAKK